MLGGLGKSRRRSFDPEYIKETSCLHKRVNPLPLKLCRRSLDNLAISAKVNPLTPRVGRDHDDSIRDGLLIVLAI